MSYPFNLRFLVGRLLVDENIEEKVCVVEELEEELKDEKSQEETSEAEIKPNEIWSSDEIENKIENTIGLIEFQIGANHSNYNPEFRLGKTENYSWLAKGRDGIKDALNSLDLSLNNTRRINYNNSNSSSNGSSNSSSYQFYYILSSKIPPGIVSGLVKRFGKNLLEQVSFNFCKKIFWCILLKPKKTKRETSNKFDPFLTDQCNGSNRFHTDRLNYDIVGESLSTNCAEISHTF